MGRRRLGMGIAAALGGALAGACAPGVRSALLTSTPTEDPGQGPVRVPEDDDTPPYLSFVLPDFQSGTFILHPDDPPLVIPAGEARYFYASAIAKDPEGVKEVGIGHHVSVGCVAADGRRNDVDFSLRTVKNVSAAQQPGDVASTRLWIALEATFEGWGCGPGERLDQIAISLVAYATNFGGQSVGTNRATFVQTYRDRAPLRRGGVDD